MVALQQLYCLLIILSISASASTASSVVELSEKNWDNLTKGKSIFVKFCAKACSHCNAMKYAWERLGKTWAENENALVGRVDCDQETRLCKKFEVLGTPTLLYGDPVSLQEYAGDKDYNALHEWAEQVLVPICSLHNTKACSEMDRQRLDEWMNMSLIEIDALIKGVKDEERNAQREFDEQVQKLQKQYDAYNDMHARKKAFIQNEIKFLKTIRQQSKE